jgi:hypothetical protein
VNIFNESSLCPDVSIRLRRLTGMMEPNIFTEIGDLALNPLGQPPGYFTGFVTIDYTDLDDERFKLKVCFFLFFLLFQHFFHSSGLVLYLCWLFGSLNRCLWCAYSLNRCHLVCVFTSSHM